MSQSTASAGRPLIVAGVLAVLLSTAGTLLPRSSDPEPLFGVDRYRELGVPSLVAASVVLLALLIVPGLAAREHRTARGCSL